MDLHTKLNQGLLSILYKPERNIGFHWITSYIVYKTIAQLIINCIKKIKKRAKTKTKINKKNIKLMIIRPQVNEMLL